MRRLLDIFRLIVISPELLILLVILIVAQYVPAIVETTSNAIRGNLMIGVGGAAAPLAMLAWGWTQCWHLLSLSGTQRVLRDWPDYLMLKDRAIACLAWCGIGSGVGFVGFAFVSGNLHQNSGVGLFIGGILAASAATVSLGLARLRLRELLDR